MLDSQLSAVLKVLNQLSDGSYKIAEADEIIGKLPEPDRCTKVELAGFLRMLADNDYIGVKYSSIDEYCFATLSKARVIETAKEETPEEPEEEPGVPEDFKKDLRLERISVRKTVFRAAFFGAFVGGLLAAVAALLVGIFLDM